MKKIPSLFRRFERSSMVDTHKVTPECAWVFDSVLQPICTVKHDGTPMLWQFNQWFQRRVLKSKCGQNVEDIIRPHGFVPCQELPTYDDENGKFEWPGWVPLEKQFTELVVEAVVSRGGMKDDENGRTFELCGPKINGNPEGWDTHNLFMHGSQIVLLGEQVTISPDTLCDVVRSLSSEGIVMYEVGSTRMAKLKRRDLGLEWPIQVVVASSLPKN